MNKNFPKTNRKSNPTWHRWQAVKKRAKRMGIKFCDRWKDFLKFQDDMGVPPIGCVIDRIDNSKGYEPSNCRWASYKLSTENRRNTVWLEWRCKKWRVNDFANEIGVPSYLVWNRLYMGWSIDKIASSPTKENNRRLGKVEITK